MSSYADEIDWLKKLAADNSASMLYARIADQYLQMKEIDRAIEFANKGVLLHPHYATARYVLAKCFFENSQFDEANKHLKEALAVDPEHLGALNLQGDLFKRLDDLPSVEKNYRRILEIDPLNKEILRNLDELHQDVEQVGVIPDFEPDDSLDSGLSHPAKEELQTEEIGDDIISESPLDEFDFGETASTETATSETLEGFDDFFPDAEPAAEAVEENPFEDFEQKESVKTTTPKVEVDANAEAEAGADAGGAAQESEMDPAKIRDEVLDESIDDEFEIDRSKYKEEESRFTELLDNIFSSSIDEEEKAESDIRDTIERMAKEDSAPAGMSDKPTPPDESADDFAPLIPPDRSPSPEEQIIESGKDKKDDFFDLGLELEDSEEEISNELFPQEDMENQSADDADVDLPDIQEDVKLDNTLPEADFSEFISSLDINEELEPADKDQSLDDSLPDFDLDLEDEVAPAIHTQPMEEKVADNKFNIPETIKDEADNGSLDVIEEDERPEPSDGEPQTPPVQQQAAGEAVDEIDASQPEFAGSTRTAGRGKFVTPTLGEIYADQGQYSKAIAVYETLSKNEPENEMYRQKLESLKKKLDEQQRGY